MAALWEFDSLPALLSSQLWKEYFFFQTFVSMLNLAEVIQYLKTKIVWRRKQSECQTHIPIGSHFQTYAAWNKDNTSQKHHILYKATLLEVSNICVNTDKF